MNRCVKGASLALLLLGLTSTTATAQVGQAELVPQPHREAHRSAGHEADDLPHQLLELRLVDCVRRVGARHRVLPPCPPEPWRRPALS